MTMVKNGKNVYPAGEFKAKCLGLLDKVAKEYETIYITKRGKLVATLAPLPEEIEEVRQSLAGSVVYEEDIVSPVDEEWEVEQ